MPHPDIPLDELRLTFPGGYGPGRTPSGGSWRASAPSAWAAPTAI
ncbi:hypothetical protein SSCG_02156 [Streptomyces clavuligerus]|nr:hypothetical protein SSCG_02156 [Streptomyces clavuligerus]